MSLRESKQIIKKKIPLENLIDSYFCIHCSVEAIYGRYVEDGQVTLVWALFLTPAVPML